ncbi:Helicase C-terminal [Penicillium sp. IBT 35674x]|nr:Helicase C-terminal [Penicillium sp. IBT 35674x]
MWNKPLDSCGYLSLLWTKMTGTHSIIDLPYHLLSPGGLLSLSQNEHLTSQVGFDCLPILLRLTCLGLEPGRRTVCGPQNPIFPTVDLPYYLLSPGPLFPKPEWAPE